jgi:hypothetical protein
MADPNITSIGSSGRTYSSVSGWESATQSGPGSSQREFGEIYDDSDLDTRNTSWNGAASSSSYYRQLRAASGHEFDPADYYGSDTGYNAMLYCERYGPEMLGIDEDYAVFGPHIGCEWRAVGTLNTPNGCHLVSGIDTYVTIDSVHFDGTNFANSGSGTCRLINMYYRCGYSSVRNCIVNGGDASKVIGIGWGSDNQMDYTECINNTVVNCSDSGVGYGILYDGTGGQQGTVCANNICIDNDTDFDFGPGFSQNDYNCSSDSTATGSNSLTGETASNNFEDLANYDYHLASGSNCIDAGYDHSAIFTNDFEGTTRSGTWDMGAYDESAAPVSFIKTKVPVNVHLRR